VNCGCKNRHFLVIANHFLQFFSKKYLFLLIFNRIFFFPIADGKQKKSKNCLLFKYFLYLQTLSVEPKVGDCVKTIPVSLLKTKLKWKTTNN